MKGCDSNFTAGHDLVITPESVRYGINGAGAVVCGRHDFFFANGVGDLEKGERYVTYNSFTCPFSDHRPTCA